MLDTVTASAEREAGYWVLDVGSWMLEVGLLDTGYWSLVFFLGVRHCDRAFGGSSTKQFIL
jgi:hypothetical protein